MNTPQHLLLETIKWIIHNSPGKWVRIILSYWIFSSTYNLMPTGQFVLTIVDPQLDGVSSVSWKCMSPQTTRNRRGFPNLLQKKNTGPRLLLVRKLFGFAKSNLNYDSLKFLQLLHMLTIWVHYGFHKKIQSFIFKHIEVNCHSIWEAYDDHTITLPHVFGSLKCKYFHKDLDKKSLSIHIR